MTTTSLLPKGETERQKSGTRPRPSYVTRPVSSNSPPHHSPRLGLVRRRKSQVRGFPEANSHCIPSVLTSFPPWSTSDVLHFVPHPPPKHIDRFSPSPYPFSGIVGGSFFGGEILMKFSPIESTDTIRPPAPLPTPDAGNE